LLFAILVVAAMPRLRCRLSCGARKPGNAGPPSLQPGALQPLLFSANLSEDAMTPHLMLK